MSYSLTEKSVSVKVLPRVLMCWRSHRFWLFKWSPIGSFTTRYTTRKTQNHWFAGSFQSIFPIVSNSGYARLDFSHYMFEEPSFDVQECQMRGMTYAAPLRANIN